MKYVPYVGSGPYCYANSFAMMFGENAPSTAAIEFATSSPFGMQLVGGALPFFDPYGWTPEAGFNDALDAMGWSSAATKGGKTGRSSIPLIGRSPFLGSGMESAQDYEDMIIFLLVAARDGHRLCA